ncbi:conserved hypothetical protein [Aeromonas veronii]|uniref:Uncharacterized protein n=1 Tax=Aeromonas veronii TaxID=654 RepID=A0A653L6P3_AERVE|nr:conserved hypothetical protein [Aeromonas veronii]
MMEAPFLLQWVSRLSVGIEIQTQAVDAVALACLGRAVGEDVTEVRAALAAGDLHPLHAVAVVLGVLHRPLDGLVERGPAAAGIKLGS